MMRNTLLLTLLILTGASEAMGQACFQMRGSRITTRSVGPVRLGMRRQQVKHLCAAAKDTTWTNDDYVELENGLLLVSGGDSIWATLDTTDVVVEIYIFTAGPGRSGGLKVGARLRSVVRRGSSGGASEAWVWVSRPNECGLSFTIDGYGDAEVDLELSERQLRRLPASTHVSMIAIKRCSRFDTGDN